MTKLLDLAIELNEDGIYDLVIENGQFKQTDTFDTAILITFFAERRANATEQPINELRRGWWGNELSDIEGFEIGSKLWLLEQSRNTDLTLSLAVNYTKQAFDWFVDDQLLQNIVVSGERSRDGIAITIQMERSGDVVGTSFFNLWENTLEFSSLKAA